MEEGEDEVSKFKSSETTRTEGERICQHPKNILEAGEVISCALANKIVAQLGYISKSDYYLIENYLGTKQYVEWRGMWRELFDFPSYPIY